MGECKHWAQPACKRRITTESFCFLPLHPSTPTYTRPPPAPTRTSLPKHPRVAAPFPGRSGNGGRYESRSEPLALRALLNVQTERPQECLDKAAGGSDRRGLERARLSRRPCNEPSRIGGEAVVVRS